MENNKKKKIVKCPDGVVKCNQKNRGTIAVYAIVEKRYNKEKRYNEDVRKYIGKMVDDEYMEANESFFEFFPEETPLEEPSDKSGSLHVGLYIIIKYILEKLNLNSILEEVYSSASGIIKDLATYLIVSENNVMQHFPDYEFDHPQFNNKSVSDSYISELLKSMPISQHENFLDLWNEIQPHNEKSYISYDSTNSSTSAKGIELAEFGHAKSDEGLPIVNTGMAYNETTGTPLFYQDYPGSIIDNTQFVDMIERSNRYGYNNVGFILDRGYFSKDNIKFMDNNNYSFIMMAKGNANFVKDNINLARENFEKDSSYFMPNRNLYGITIKSKLYSDDNKDRYIHIYWDKRRAGDEEVRVLNSLSAMEEDLKKLSEKNSIEKENIKKYIKFFNIDYNDKENKIMSYSRDEVLINKHLQRCGCFAIITSEEMTKEEAINKYRHRDAIEKLFAVSKSFLGEDIFRVHTSTSLHSKQQIIFIAEILRNELFNCLSTIKENDKKNYTIPSVIREMEKIEVLQTTNGKYHLRFSLTKKQKTILNSLNMDEKDFISHANDICKKYSK